MNTLEKKLTEIAEAKAKGKIDLVAEAKILLLEDAQEERATLRSIGLDHNIRKAEKVHEELIIRSNAGKKLERNIVSFKELEILCKTYHLMMRPASQFIGTIPAELGAELNRFCKEKNIVMTASSSYSLFFVVALPRMFDGYLTGGEVITKALNQQRAQLEAEAEEKRRQRLIRDQDPILVYRLPESPNHFAVVRSWGDDMTSKRKLLAFLSGEKTMLWITVMFNVLLTFVLFEIGMGLVKYFYATSEVNAAGYHGAWWLVKTIASTAILLTIELSWLFGYSKFRSNVRNIVSKGRVWFSQTNDHDR